MICFFRWPQCMLRSHHCQMSGSWSSALSLSAHFQCSLHTIQFFFSKVCFIPFSIFDLHRSESKVLDWSVHIVAINGLKFLLPISWVETLILSDMHFQQNLNGEADILNQKFHDIEVPLDILSTRYAQANFVYAQNYRDWLKTHSDICQFVVMIRTVTLHN